MKGTPAVFPPPTVSTQPATATASAPSKAMQIFVLMRAMQADFPKPSSPNESSKFQTPNSRETPSSKSQIQMSKARPLLARVRKLEFGIFLELGFWDLELLWCLEVGVWSFCHCLPFVHRYTAS